MGGGHEGEECQNAQERQELPVQSQTQPVWGRESERGIEAGPPTQGHVKKKIPFCPPTHLPSHPCGTHHSAPLHILGRQSILKLFSKREKQNWSGERHAEMQETVEVCLGVTGLRGAFSHRVVSEALCMLRPLWLTFFILQMRQSRVCIALLIR